jgi:hypothetical protein
MYEIVFKLLDLQQFLILILILIGTGAGIGTGVAACAELELHQFFPPEFGAGFLLSLLV